MKVEEFISLLFEIELTTHIMHLQTTSYSQHIALNEIYSSIVDLRDRFTEGYQGKYGIVYNYSITKQPEGNDPVKYLLSKSKEIENYRLSLQDGFLQQIIDDILELIYSTVYKLKNLK